MFQSHWAAQRALSLGSIMIALLVGGVPSLTQGLDAAPPERKEGDQSDAGKARQPIGDAKAGRDVFRFETFGNEDFWTDAMRLPEGVMNAKFTPMDALKAGMQVDVEMIEPELRKALAAELKTDHSPENAPMLNDVKTTMALIKSNAVIGVVPKGNKIGISCTICHAVTDGSVANMPGGGSIGRRVDGPAAINLDMGGLLAMAANSKAYYPNLQLELGGKTIGKAPKGIRADSTEEEVDAYLMSKDYYPRGTFDETQDGIGNPVQNTPIFRQDLAGPYGSNGMHERFAGISNASYTTNLDPTALATPEGLTLLTTVAGKNGKELHNNYVKILADSGVTGYPFVDATMGHKVGHRDTPVGKQVDKQKVLDMQAYTFQLAPPKLSVPAGTKFDGAALARSEKLFQANCTSCHGADQSQPVPAKLISLKELWPAYKPVQLAEREAPLSPIMDSPGGYDDKMVILDASERGAGRGVALPLLLDLARKPNFLHDNSVEGLDSLLNPKRGDDAPHPFYLEDATQRKEMVDYLYSLNIK